MDNMDPSEGITVITDPGIPHAIGLALRFHDPPTFDELSFAHGPFVVFVAGPPQLARSLARRQYDHLVSR